MRWPLRAGVVIAAASTALLVQRVAIAGGTLARGWDGALLTRLDLAAPAVIGLVAFVAARRCLAGGALVPDGMAWLTAVYVGWALTIVFAKTALHLQASPARLLATLVFFRGTGTPLPGLGAGPLLLSVVLTTALMPMLVSWCRVDEGPARVRRWAVPVFLGLVAVGVRVVCTATGHIDLFGPLSWLPNQLDLVGAGLGLALVEHSAIGVHARRRLRLGGLVAAVVSFCAAAFSLGLPRSPDSTPPRTSTSLRWPRWCSSVECSARCG